jgi:hypothetical protein
MVISCCVSILFAGGNVLAQTDGNHASSPFVQELRTLLDTKRPDLKNSLIKLIDASAKDKTSYRHAHDGLEEFYRFLDTWRTYTPDRIANAQDFGAIQVSVQEKG